MTWEMLSPVIATLIAVAATQAAVVLTNSLRRHDFKRFENKSKAELERDYPLATLGPSVAEERYDALAPLLAKVHQTANATQTRYHNAVVRSAGCLTLATAALALGTLSLDRRPTLLLSWLEAIAFLFVLLLFPHGRGSRQPWIEARAGAEFLRQYQLLRMVFPDATAPSPAAPPEAAFAQEASAVAAQMHAGNFKDIIIRIDRYWSTRQATLERAALSGADVTADAVLVYLRRRARRQLGWFLDSKARLEHIAERRSRALVGLYGAAVLLAWTRHGLCLYLGQAPEYLLPPLLIVAGMSAAMTAYYINQNSRSLIHRYNAQQRRIARWLTAFDERWCFKALPSMSIDQAAKDDMRERILQFEDLMIEELTDWVHITSHDTIELAPS